MTAPDPLPLVDVSGLDLDDLLSRLGDTALSAALHRVTEEAVNPTGVPFAAFDSSI